MHNLATDAVTELEDARKEPPVSFMHHDGQGHVWLGHKGGMVRVWCESSLTPVTLPIKCFHAEIRCLACSAQDICAPSRHSVLMCVAKLETRGCVFCCCLRYSVQLRMPGFDVRC